MPEVLEVGKLRIGTEVDPSGLKRAEADLNRESEGVGKRAGGALKRGVVAGLAGISALIAARVSSATKGVLGVVARGATNVFDAATLGVLGLTRAVRELSAHVAESNSHLAGMAKVLNVVATAGEKVAKVFLTVSGVLNGTKLAAAGAAAAVVVLANRAAAEMVPAWNRVRTLLQDSPADLTELRRSISEVSAAAGIESREGFGAFYQILSAMPELIREPTRALDILAVSLDVASTGFGTAEESASALTAILNAFNLEAEDARQVSDALFAAQDQGVTTFGEIASSIGTVADLASSLGLAFEDVLGILATTTDTGVTTAERFTQMRAVISALVNPTNEAEEAVGDLDINLGAAALRSEGLVGFLLRLIDVTDANPDVLAKIFPQESLALVLSLARQTDTLREKTEGIATASGTTAEKVEIVNESIQRQIDLIEGRFRPTLENLGYTLRRLTLKELTAFNDLLGTVSDNLDAISEAGEFPSFEELRREAGGFDPSRQTVPGVEVLARRRGPIPTPAEPTSIEYSRDKIRELNDALRASAVIQLAATGNTEEYEQAIRAAQERVNDLVISEMERLRQAGVAEEEVRKLASAYQVLSDRTDEATKAAEERARALDTLRSIEEDVAGRVASLTRTATDELAAELDRLEERAREAAEKAGEALSEEFLGQLERLRQNVEDIRLFEGFSERFEQVQAGGGFGQAVSLEAFITDIREAIGGLEEGTDVQRRMNALLEDALELRERGAEAARESREQTEAEARAEAERQARQAERAEEERIRRLRESARLVEENARAALQLAEAFGLVDQEAARALQSVAQLGTSIFRVAGGDLSAIPSAIGALASLGSQLFGGDSAAEQERQRRIEENTEALKRAADRMDELGARLASASVPDVLDQRRTLDYLQNPPLGKIIPPDFAVRVAQEYGVDLRTATAEQLEELARVIELALEAAREQIQRDLDTDLAAREAALAGDDVGVVRARATGRAAEQRQEAQQLLEAGFITVAQYGRLLRVINGELEKAVEDAEEAARKAEEATERRRRSFEADVTAREAALRGEGLEAQQERLREQAAAELDAARDLLDAGTISEELFQRLAAVIEGELNQALEDAAEAAQRVADGFRADVVAREAALAGDDRDALRTRIEARNAEELAAAEELLEAGTITEELFRRLADVLDGELTQALERFDQAAADAAFREAQDLGRLNVQILREQGQDAAALALEQRLELEAARRAGATAEYINRLQVLHAIRMQEIRAVDDTTRAIEARTRALNAPRGFSLPDVLHRSITQGAPAVSQTSTTTINREGGSFVFNVYGQEGMSAEEIARATRRQFEDWISAGGTATGFWGPSG